MKYQNYERKIKTIKLVKDAIHSVRFWIIGGVSVAAVTTSTLLGVKGITEVENMPNTIEYGVAYTPTSKAIMSDSMLEFAREGTNNWDLRQPKLVGKYKVRSVSTNGVGMKYYSAEEHFEIVPKKLELSISGTSITYGEKPALANYSLVGDDKLFEYSVDVTNFDAETNKCLGVFDEKSFVIQDEFLNDVTYCYDIEALSKELTFSKRPLAIAVDGDTKEYDGTPLTSDEYTILSGTLASGDQLYVGDSVQVTEIGTVQNARTVTIKNEKGEDVSAFYDITKSFGDLEVTKRKVTFSSNTVSREYDGTDVEDELTWKVSEGSLLSGDHAVISFSNENILKPTDSPIPNSFSYDILNANNVSVLSNYDVTVDAGFINIAKRELSYTTEGLNKKYDGLSFTSGDITITDGSLATGDTFEKTAAVSFRDPVSGVQNVISIEIFNEEFENVTDCYNVNPIYGDMNISKREVQFIMPSYNEVYDGEEHIVDEDDGFLYVNSYGDGLLHDHHPIIVDPMHVLEAQRYGTIEVPDTSYVKIVDNEGVDVSSCYEIDYVRSVSIIDKRELSIQASDLNKQYDGTALLQKDQIIDDSGYSILSGELADTDEIEAKYEGNSIIDAGSDEYEITVSIFNRFSSALRADNYNLTVLNGNYDVTKPDIFIRTKDYTKDYDGTNTLPTTQKDVLWELVGDVSANDEFLVQPKVATEGVNACTSENAHSLTFTNQSSVKLRDKTTKLETTSNYNIFFQPDFGHLIINKLQVTIAPQETDFTYDAKKRKVEGYWEQTKVDEYVNNGNFTVIGQLAVGDKLSVGNESTVEVYKFEHSGTAIDLSSAVVTNKAGTDVTNNYRISYSDVLTYNIRKRTLIIETDSVTQVYNNTPLVKDTAQFESAQPYSDAGLANGDYLVFDWPKGDELNTCRPTKFADNKNSSKNLNTYKSVKVYNKDNDEVTTSYNIQPVYGSLSIQKLAISISFTNIKREYKGESFASQDFVVTTTSQNSGAVLHLNSDLGFKALPDDFVVKGHFSPSVVNNYAMSGQYNDFSDDIYFSVETNSGEVLCANNKTYSDPDGDFAFAVSTIKGSLEITKKDLKIKNYPFKTAYYDGVVAWELKSVSGLANGDALYLVRPGAVYDPSTPYTASEVATNFEAYEATKEDYESQEDFDHVGSGENKYGKENYVVLRLVNGQYVDVTASYNITEEPGDYVISANNY